MYIPLGTLRLLLATFVFLVHTESVMPVFAKQVNYAGLGVWMFFIVSGYVIFSAHDNFYRNRAIAYLFNRCLRIYPTLWACFLLSLLLLYLEQRTGLALEGINLDGFGIREFFLGLSIIGGFINDKVWNPLAPAATLTIELKFYLAAGAVFLIVEFLRTPVRKSLFWAALFFLAASVLVNLTGSQFRWFGALRYAPLFVIGGVFYYAVRLGHSDSGIRILFAVTLLLVIHYMLVSGSSTGYSGFELSTRKLVTGGLVLALLVALNVLVRSAVEPRIKHIDRFLGDLTYPLYLVQVPLLSVMLPLREWSGPVDWLMLYVINLAAAVFINYALERPLIGLRRRFRGRAIGVDEHTAGLSVNGNVKT